MRGIKTSEGARVGIIAALLEGGAVSETARRFGVEKATVTRIKQLIPEKVLNVVETEHQDTIYDLIADHLRASLHGATRIAELTENTKWIEQQSVKEIRDFYGELTEKSIRIYDIFKQLSLTIGQPGTPDAL